MSAPRTNLERQKRRHIVPLVGMGLAALFAVGLIVYWQFEEAAQGNSPTPDVPAELPVSPIEPEVIEPRPQADPSVPQDSIAPQPQPQDD